MAEKPFVVVGAGLGGLAAALRLAHRGRSVIVLEKTDQVGGRNRSLHVNGCYFDAGPTLMMMLDPFYRLFEDVGERLDDHLKCSLCDPSYRVFYSDGSRIEATTNPDRMQAQITALAGEKDAQQYSRLVEDLSSMYRDVIPTFVRKNFDHPLDFFGLKQLNLVAKHKMLANLASRVAKYFEDPKLRMLFSFQTMYLGLSPYRAPWVYAVLTYMECGEGIWYPEGGIAEISRSVARLAEQKGAEIRLNSEVVEIHGCHVRLKSGENIEAEAILCNADLPYAQKELQRAVSRRKHRYSCSAYMMYIDYQGSLPDLLHHNVFFSPNFNENLEQIFERSEMPDEPSFYAAVSKRTDPSKAPEGHENLYILVPCPNLDRPWSASDECHVKAKVFERLRAETGFQAENITSMKTYTPLDWKRDLNLDKGAAFGLSHDFWQSAYFRPSNKSQTNPNLYFVGASTVPGNGLPMVLISAELAENRLQKDGKL